MSERQPTRPSECPVRHDVPSPAPPDPAPHLGEYNWGRRLRPDLPPLPARMAELPVHRGYPVPWFVAWPIGASEPDFRVADAWKMRKALSAGLCWVCGTPRGRGPMAFVVGPMCALNRITAEPACHLECARWSAIACPFLSRPHMTRREHGMPEGVHDPAGEMIRRNPGATLVWITKRFELVKAPGGMLISLGPPTKVEAYACGRAATKAELVESIRTGLPLLQAKAAEDGPRGVERLQAMTKSALRVLGLRPEVLR